MKCNKCGKDNLTPADFYAGERPSHACRDCHKKIARASEAKRRATPKVCAKCGQTKRLVDFYVQSATKDGFKSICKQCERNRKPSSTIGRHPKRFAPSPKRVELSKCIVCRKRAVEGENFRLDDKFTFTQQIDAQELSGVMCEICIGGEVLGKQKTSVIA